MGISVKKYVNLTKNNILTQPIRKYVLYTKTQYNSIILHNTKDENKFLNSKNILLHLSISQTVPLLFSVMLHISSSPLDLKYSTLIKYIQYLNVDKQILLHLYYGDIKDLSFTIHNTKLNNIISNIKYSSLFHLSIHHFIRNYSLKTSILQNYIRLSSFILHLDHTENRYYSARILITEQMESNNSIIIPEIRLYNSNISFLNRIVETTIGTNYSFDFYFKKQLYNDNLILKYIWDVRE